MKDCFVRSLKFGVDDSYDKLGVIPINVTPVSIPSEDLQKLVLRTVTEGTTVTIVGDGYLSTNYSTLNQSTLKTYTLDANTYTNLFFTNGTYKIEISNKYGLTHVLANSNYKSIFNFDLKYFEYNTNIEQISCAYGLSGDIAVLKDKPLNQFRASYSSIYGDISVFEDMPLTRLMLSAVGNIYGDIAVFHDSLISVSDIDFQNKSGIYGDVATINCEFGSFLITNTNINGEIKDFVVAQITKRPNMSTPFRCAGFLQRLTFNGNYRTSKTSNRNWLVWSSNNGVVSKIAVLHGANQNDVNSCTAVYTFGYTQEEAEAAFPNKEIVMVD